MKRFFTVLLVGMMCLSCFAGCSNSSGGTPVETADSFKIGLSAPLTGGAAIYGNNAAIGAQIAVDEINANGVLKLELKVEDDQHDYEKAVNAYNALMDWGMQISLGAVTSAPAAAFNAAANADNVFSLTPSASAPNVTEGMDNAFQMCFADPNQGTASADYIAAKSMGTKIAVIYENDISYSTGIYETFVKRAKQIGLDIVSVTTFTADSQTDFTVQLSEAKAAGADVLFLPIYYEAASSILTQAAAMDYKPVFFGADGLDGILTMKGFDTSLAEGAILLTPFTADQTGAESFVAEYNKRTGEDPNQFAADAYDAVYVIYNLLVSTGCNYNMTAAQIGDLLKTAILDYTFTGGLTVGSEGATWNAEGAVSKQPKGMVIENGVYVGLD